MSDAARAFIDNARELPVMPAVATEVMRQAEDPDADPARLAELISRDAGLATRVLRIANSSMYAMRREIDTIQQSIVLLGFATLRSIVVAASLKDVFANYGMTERLLWDHAVAGGLAANAVALEVSGFAADEVFIAGLMHDIGKLTMHAQDGQRYAQVTQVVYAGENDSISAENDVFGFDHATIGALLLRRWELPERLALAVSAHHDPESATDEAKPLAALLQVADLLCLQQGLGRPHPDPELRPLDCAGARLLGAGDIEPERVITGFKEMLEKERDLFA